MSVTYARGFVAGAVACGVRHGTPDRLDVAVIAADRSCDAAALYTANQVVAAPLQVTRRHLRAARPRAVIVNSGNANACTGERGERDAEAMAVSAAQVLTIRPEEVLVASTGVIGVPLPVERIEVGLERLTLSVDGGDDAARAIMTTDTRPKTATLQIQMGAGTVRIGGMAKGAGMIHPELATMLCFLTTDAMIESGALQDALRDAAASSFNAISVDGDTSTNDMVVALASGRSGITITRAERPRFAEALLSICQDLARAIVADGEGATRVFEVRIAGARNEDEARRAARTIASSNLVKAAVHGADPNWGRILAAAGRSGARVDDRRASVRVDGRAVFERGSPCAFDSASLRAALRRDRVAIELDLALGDGRAVAWGCDLSAEYVRINADYTT